MNQEITRLLVVDDLPDNRDLLSRRLRLAGFDVVEAEGGKAALALVDRGRFDCILLDIMMPDMSGIEVLAKLRARYTRSQLPVIMTTALSQSDDIVKALAHGANDYVTKPFDVAVLRARVETHVGLKRATEKLREAYQNIMRDLQAAARIQKTLLPRALPEDDRVRFAWTYHPCQTLAGDMLNVVRLDATRYGMYLLDVSGHGVPAALLTNTLHHVLTAPPGNGSILWECDEENGAVRVVRPVEVVRRLNLRFPMDNVICQYFTLLYGVLDTANRTFCFVSAGHPGPLKIGHDGGVDLYERPGYPVGWVVEDPGYEEQEITVEPGDRIYLYCDGVVEARDFSGNLFGRDRMAETLRDDTGRNLKDGLERLVKSVRIWAMDAPQDDISILGFEFI